LPSQPRRPGRKSPARPPDPPLRPHLAGPLRRPVRRGPQSGARGPQRGNWRWLNNVPVTFRLCWSHRGTPGSRPVFRRRREFGTV